MESEIITTTADEAIVLFELSSGGGALRSPKPPPQELATKSAQALGQAMGTIQALANRTTETLAKLPKQPSEFELEFGIKVDAQAGVLVSASGAEGNLRVKLVWKADPL